MAVYRFWPKQLNHGHFNCLMAAPALAPGWIVMQENSFLLLFSHVQSPTRPLPGCPLYGFLAWCLFVSISSPVSILCWPNVWTLTCKASCCTWTTIQFSRPNILYHPSLLKCLLWCCGTTLGLWEELLTWQLLVKCLPHGSKCSLCYHITKQTKHFFCCVACYSIKTMLPSFTVILDLCTFCKSPRCGWLVLAIRFDGAIWWQYTIFGGCTRKWWWRFVICPPSAHHLCGFY